MKEVYRVLNPESWMAPFNAVPLNPRPGSLNGKVIGIVGQNHEPMLYLKDALKAALPGIKNIVVYKENKEKYAERGGIPRELQEGIRTAGIDVAIQGIAH